MYRVVCITDGTEYVLHDVYALEEQIFNDELSEEMGKTATFNFSILAGHPNIDKIVPLSSEILIYHNGKVDFFGRAITPQADIYNTQSVSCVGGLSYLADSMQAPFTLESSMIDFLVKVLSVHNSMVEERKRFKLGTVNVAGRITSRTVDTYTDTLTLLNNQLINEYGGYLRARQESDGRYLDYVEDYGGYNSQEVRFGENVLDISQQIDASDVITVLIPEGASVEISNSDGTTTEKRVSIATVNNDINYIRNENAISKWGLIWGYAQFDEISDPALLLAESKRYLDRKVTFPLSVEFTALDLSYVDVDIERLELGKWTQFISVSHEISGTYLLQKLTRHLSRPELDTVSFGCVQQGLSGTSASNVHAVNLKIDKVRSSLANDIAYKVENATKLITGGLGGYVVIGQAEDGHPEEILVMDAPTKAAAKNVIRLNKNGLGFSTTGYSGVFRNAWTIDGNLVADFITTGSMLADRIRGGTLELGGTGLGKDGSILVKDASGNTIGSWNKTGLSILKGILQGVSAVFGGKGNANGTIEVRSSSGGLIGRWDNSGLMISRGVLEVGPLYVDEDYVYFGDFYVSTDGSNVFRSSDGSIVFQNAQGGPLGSYPALKIGNSMVSDHHITSAYGTFERINGNCELANSGSSSNWWAGYTIFEALDWLYDAIQELEASIE